MPSPGGVLVLMGLIAIATGLDSEPPCTSPAGPGPSASSPASAPPHWRPFAPGVQIDWTGRAVRVESRVVLRHGALEFFACLAGKEHESILRLEASAAHVFQALGLVGISPGHPPCWNEARGSYDPPAGDLVEVACEWDEPGGPRTVGAFQWLREIEYGRPPLPRPWVFAGSLRLPDGSLAADRSGAGLALVDFPDSLMALSGAHTSRNDELWVEARTEAIPMTGTPIRVILLAARPRELRVRLDFRGAAYVEDRLTSVPDLADLLRLSRQLSPERVQRIVVDRALAADVCRVREQLVALGLPPGATRFERQEGVSTRPSSNRIDRP